MQAGQSVHCVFRICVFRERERRGWRMGWGFPFCRLLSCLLACRSGVAHLFPCTCSISLFIPLYTSLIPSCAYFLRHRTYTPPYTKDTTLQPSTTLHPTNLPADVLHVPLLPSQHLQYLHRHPRRRTQNHIHTNPNPPHTSATPPPEITTSPSLPTYRPTYPFQPLQRPKPPP